MSEKLASVSGKLRHEVMTVSDYPAVGDYVIANWPDDASNAVIRSIFPRKSCFMRKAAGPNKKEQVVAANLDTVFICMSLNNNYNIRRLERYLAIAYDSGAEPVIILTKKDLCDDVESLVKEVQEVAPNVEVLAVSSTNDDFDPVLKYVTYGKTIAFLGSSGVGKSTLINKLLGSDQIVTGGIGIDDKGRHTTTHRELITLDNGAFLIDTPGMRELGMWDNADGIETVFSDIEELTGQCKFSDCSHKTEPACAIQKALAEGYLDWARWEAYLKLKIENAISECGSQYPESKRAKFKAIAKTNRKNRR